MLAYELSSATLVPNDGSAPIRFRTSYLPSGGFGLHFHPGQHIQVGARVILNHDFETRTQGASSRKGFLRSYEYRLGAAYAPWKGTLFDVGGAVLDRWNGLEKTSTFKVGPTLGVEQALVQDRFWLRAGLDETTWTGGLSVAIGVVKVDLAGLYNLAQARTADVFGKRNVSVIATVNFDYARAFGGERSPPSAPTPASRVEPGPPLQPVH